MAPLNKRMMNRWIPYPSNSSNPSLLFHILRTNVYIQCMYIVQTSDCLWFMSWLDAILRNGLQSKCYPAKNINCLWWTWSFQRWVTLVTLITRLLEQSNTKYHRHKRKRNIFWAVTSPYTLSGIQSFSCIAILFSFCFIVWSSCSCRCVGLSVKFVRRPSHPLLKFLSNRPVDCKLRSESVGELW